MLPGGAATERLINAEVLAALGARGILINVARGSVVDQHALIEALMGGVIAGAASGRVRRRAPRSAGTAGARQCRTDAPRGNGNSLHPRTHDQPGGAKSAIVVRRPGPRHTGPGDPLATHALMREPASQPCARACAIRHGRLQRVLTSKLASR